ncbi:hypothetical protein [Streptomyces canus]
MHTTAAFGEAGKPLYETSAGAVAAIALSDHRMGLEEQARAQALFQSDL